MCRALHILRFLFLKIQTRSYTQSFTFELATWTWCCLQTLCLARTMFLYIFKWNAFRWIVCCPTCHNPYYSSFPYTEPSHLNYPLGPVGIRAYESWDRIYVKNYLCGGIVVGIKIYVFKLLLALFGKNTYLIVSLNMTKRKPFWVTVIVTIVAIIVFNMHGKI